MARQLGEHLPAHATLVIASSMPIRDAELYFPARRPLPRVLSNRGANGIDGTVSTAFGVAAASDGPVVLLIGDVALAHDVGGLIAARQLGLDLTIVVVNNDGGGIFHFLPVSGESDAFEEHVATPHGLDFAKAAALYGLRPHARRDRRRARRCPRSARHRGGAHRPRREPGSAPPPRRRGAGRRASPQPDSTGSITCSLTSVSASSAAGSESRTMPQPA